MRVVIFALVVPLFLAVLFLSRRSSNLSPAPVPFFLGHSSPEMRWGLETAKRDEADAVEAEQEEESEVEVLMEGQETNEIREQ